MNKNYLLRNIYHYYPFIYEINDTSKDNLRIKKINSKLIYKKELLKHMENLADSYAVVDWTDNESCCYEFKILLHKNIPILDDDKILIKKLHGTRKDLRIFISVLEACYYLFEEKTTYSEAEDKWDFTIINSHSWECQKLIQKINDYLSQNGYMELSDSEVQTLVPDVETHYKEAGKATIFDCLFTDLVNLSI